MGDKDKYSVVDAFGSYEVKPIRGYIVEQKNRAWNSIHLIYDTQGMSYISSVLISDLDEITYTMKQYVCTHIQDL